MYKQMLAVLMGRRTVEYRQPVNINYCLLTGSAEQGCRVAFASDSQTPDDSRTFVLICVLKQYSSFRLVA